MEKKTTKKKSTTKKSVKTKSNIVVEKKKGFNSYETVLVAFVTLVIGFVIGLAVSLSAGKYSEKGVKSAIDEAYNKLLNNGYKELKEEDLTDAAIRGMMSLTDENSLYTKDSNYIDNINGYYNGLGITIGRREDGLVYVYEVNQKGPSKDLINVDDVIVSINNYIMNEYEVEKLANIIKALPVNSKVTVKVLRNGEEEVIVPIKTITLNTVSDHRIVNNNIGYIKIDYISSNTFNQVKEALDEFNNNKVEKLILDLRCNNGGDVNSLKNIASLFLDNNSVIYQQLINKEITKVYSNGNPIYKGKIVVLIDNGTASSAEMLASTLKDNLGATLIGMNTYGKYTIQTTYTLSNNSIMKYTVGEWLRSNGSSVKDVGLIPDTFISYNENQDNQYLEAIKVLEKD